MCCSKQSTNDDLPPSAGQRMTLHSLPRAWRCLRIVRLPSLFHCFWRRRAQAPPLCSSWLRRAPPSLTTIDIACRLHPPRRHGICLPGLFPPSGPVCRTAVCQPPSSELMQFPGFGQKRSSIPLEDLKGFTPFYHGVLPLLSQGNTLECIPLSQSVQQADHFIPHLRGDQHFVPSPEGVAWRTRSTELRAMEEYDRAAAIAISHSAPVPQDFLMHDSMLGHVTAASLVFESSAAPASSRRSVRDSRGDAEAGVPPAPESVPDSQRLESGQGFLHSSEPWTPVDPRQVEPCICISQRNHLCTAACGISVLMSFVFAQIVSGLDQETILAKFPWPGCDESARDMCEEFLQRQQCIPPVKDLFMAQVSCA